MNTQSAAARAVALAISLAIGAGCSSTPGGAPSDGSQADAGGSDGAGAADGGADADAGVAPPSCRATGPGLTDCGPNGESCCTSLAVSGGTYSRTYANDGSGPTGEADPATVSGFRFDKYLVTVGRFRQFVAAWNGGAGYTPPAGSGKHTHLAGGQGLADSGTPGTYEAGWLASFNDDLALTNDSLACNADYAAWTAATGDHERLPMNCVNWWEAYAFCIWDGGFLPSEAEYEYAAAGGSEERAFPWGSTPPGTASEYAIYNCNYPSPAGSCSGLANIAPVGTAARGAGRWGQLNLVGELNEWNLDWYAPYVSPCTDCAYLADGSGRVDRAGYFVSAASELAPSYRNSFYPTNRFYNYGFRCARTP